MIKNGEKTIPLVNSALRLDYRLVTMFPVDNCLSVEWRINSHQYLDDFNSNNLNTIRMLTENCQKPKPFLDFLFERNFVQLVDFTSKFHQNDKRKASGDQYFKHLLYTAYLCFHNPGLAKYNEHEKRIFIGAALLHDAIELKRKNGDFKEKEIYEKIKLDISPSALNREELRRIITICSLLTPQPKPEKTASFQWRDIKRKDFNRIIYLNWEDVILRYIKLFPNAQLTPEEAEILLEMTKQIKISDDAAILRETVDDVKNNKDHVFGEKNGLKSLEDRMTVYSERLDIISTKYQGHPLIEEMRKDIDYLAAAQ